MPRKLLIFLIPLIALAIAPATALAKNTRLVLEGTHSSSLVVLTIEGSATWAQGAAAIQSAQMTPENTFLTIFAQSPRLGDDHVIIRTTYVLTNAWMPIFGIHPASSNQTANGFELLAPPNSLANALIAQSALMTLPNNVETTFIGNHPAATFGGNTAETLIGSPLSHAYRNGLTAQPPAEVATRTNKKPITLIDLRLGEPTSLYG